jgi:hypothetical protein
MKKATLPMIALILALLVSAWSPDSIVSASTFNATATIIPFSFQNQTGSKITIVLQGPAYYTLELKTGANKVNLLPGLYQYSYTACGKPQKGTVTVNIGAKLILPKCKTTAKGTVNIQIANNTHRYLTLNLTGPATYNFSLPAGKTTITVIKGTYTYRAWGCGGASKSGTKNLSRNGFVWTWFCL